MTVADDLERARTALQMINPAPYNAEAPPEALAGDLTPTNLHYVRSNFAVPTHDGTLEVGGAVQNPTTLTLAGPPRAAGDRAGRHPRMRRERASRHETATDRGTVGCLRRLHRPLDRRPPVRRARAGAAGSRRRRRSVRRRRPRLLPPPARPARHEQGRLDLRPRSAPRPRGRPGGRDPHRLRDERPTARCRPRSPVPAHRTPLVRGRVREVAETHRRPHRAVHR